MRNVPHRGAHACLNIRKTERFDYTPKCVKGKGLLLAFFSGRLIERTARCASPTCSEPVAPDFQANQLRSEYFQTTLRRWRFGSMAKEAYFSSGLFKFLKDLAANNDRDWFKANKARFAAPDPSRAVHRFYARGAAG